MLGVFSWIVLEILKSLIKIGVMFGIIGLFVYFGYSFFLE